MAWKKIDGFAYEVSDRGEVRRIGGKVLKHGVSGKVPYHRVSLMLRGKKHTKLVHKLVLETFKENAPDGQEGRHKNGKPENNSLNNLEWGTPQQNEEDKKRHGTCAAGEKNGNSKLTADQVIEIRTAPKGKINVIAKQLGVTPSHAYNLRCGKWWQ